MATETPSAAPKPASPYTRTNPFPGKLTVNRSLCGEGSDKDTRHFEIDLTGWGLSYEVGDSMTVWATNDPKLVDEILKAICAKGDEKVKGPKGETTVREALLRDCRITQTTPKFLKMISERASAAPLITELLDPERKEDLDRYLWGMEVIDFLTEHPSIKISPQDFVDVLAKLQPRLYSISSSPKTNPGRVSLTVDAVRYDIDGRTRLGVASTFLASRVAAGDGLKVYVQKAQNFGLPVDPSVPIIMIGPGTGIAPFRAFLHERMATKADGRNWLFFGHRNSASDFFYEDELSGMKAAGLLTRLSLAWSRDGDEKIYVQDRMRENGRELWAWLADGAHVYVCGDAKHMAKDVEHALIEIVSACGARTTDEAIAFVADLKKRGRYQADVY